MTSEISDGNNIKYVNYESETQMPDIMKLIGRDLSEPYSIYTYRFFINDWNKLCFLAYDGSECVGAIVGKLDPKDKDQSNKCVGSNPTNEANDKTKPSFKGYIAMLAVKKEYRGRKIGSKLVTLAVEAMRKAKADEIVLEAEANNSAALKLYENLGFLRDKRLYRYYLNGVDALRLKLWLS